jgi:hypothetical protein
MEKKVAGFVERMKISFADDYQLNPRLVKSMAEVCIQYRLGNEEEATESLSNYLTWRDKTFGGLKDHRISEDTKLREQLQTNFLRLSPKRLKSGAAVLYVTMKDHDPSLYSTADSIKAIHFFIIAAMVVDPDLARDGFVVINDFAGVEFHNLDMNFPVAIAPALGKSTPVRLVKIVITNAPMVLRFIVPIVKAILPKKLLDRLHVVEDSALPELLAVALGDLPIELGGMIAMDPDYDLQQLLIRRWCV